MLGTMALAACQFMEEPGMEVQVRESKHPYNNNTNFEVRPRVVHARQPQARGRRGDEAQPCHPLAQQLFPSGQPWPGKCFLSLSCSLLPGSSDSVQPSLFSWPSFNRKRAHLALQESLLFLQQAPWSESLASSGSESVCRSGFNPHSTCLLMTRPHLGDSHPFV